MLLGREFQTPAGTWDYGVAQWNILADRLSDAFPQVEKEYLSWSHRGPLIKQELRNWLHQGLIVCLEECDKFQELADALFDVAEGVFAEKDVDGCAVFVPRDRFRILTAEHETLIGGGRSQLGLFVRLESILPGDSQQFLVCVTHLKAKLGFEEIRREQAAALCAKTKLRSNPDDIVIIAGDFNDEPSSAAVSVLRKNGFCDAYEKTNLQKYTTSKIRDSLVTRTIDYIWFAESGKLKCVDCLIIPPQESLGACALPNQNYPSDHLGIVARFRREQK